MAIMRLALLIMTVIAQQYGTMPPNSRPPAERLREQHGPERSIPVYSFVVRTMIWSWPVLEGSVLFALSGYCPPVLAHPLLYVLPPNVLASDPTALTPAFLTGSFLSISGTALRVYCFHALGSHFTFELSILPTHTLITDDIYSVVRHPSYTGFLAVAFGYFLCVFDPRGIIVSVLAARFGHATVRGALTCFWAIISGILPHGMIKRISREDTMLEKNFGEEWRAWAKKVPYRLVPGVY